MRKLLYGLIGASALAMASAVSAATVVLTPGTVLSGPPQLAIGESATFLVSGNPASGPLTASLTHIGIPAGSFEDFFTFTILQDGFGSGSVTTSVNLGDLLGITNLDFTGVTVNGLSATPEYRDASNTICFTPGVGTCGNVETFAIQNVPIINGVLNTIHITGLSRGNGSYGGQATFAPGAVPEPATWAMMLFGFGAIGFTMRRKRAAALRQLA